MNFIKSLQGVTGGVSGASWEAPESAWGHPGASWEAPGSARGRPWAPGEAPEGVRTTKGGLGKGLGPSQKCKKRVFLVPWRPDAHISMVF